MSDTERGSRTLHRIRLVVLVVAVAISVLSVLLVVGAWRNDVTIDSDKGVATAEVLSAGKLRSAVSFITPDGVTHNPRLGVLYPTNLVVGQRIEVEYYKADSDDNDSDSDLLVRVAGRDATVAIVPAGSVIVVTWLIALPALFWLRRKETQRMGAKRMEVQDA
ncbi:MAG: DUF3592 domain-containing protein [Rhodococcus sp.]|nr:DUF3592 domain-containing protein [Rhodococcus sp. (in: high G+C Gram-positive bacteria)]MCX6491591.1 DUF3592 domain-containing protein [Rhodococcus sp. (in: high G+C Gram-positive bacteria)]